MRYRALGSTGLVVSEVALGTVELGMDYGFRGSTHFAQPSRTDAIRLLRKAFDAGITLVDTAPSYGSSEALIGEAFDGVSLGPYIATKVIVPEENIREAMLESIHASLRLLHKETLDLLQIHNTSNEILNREEVFRTLEDAQRQGKVKHIGASADEEDVAFHALSRSGIATVQAPFNLLNQRLAVRVFTSVRKLGRGILVRSAFLRGVLTSHVETVPQELETLKRSAAMALELCASEVQNLAEAALRFCLSFPAVSTVVLGMRSMDELETNLAAAAKGPLSSELVGRLHQLAFEDVTLVSPPHWNPALI